MWVLNHRSIIVTCVLIQNVCGDIVRHEDGTFEATFSVEHAARMGGHTVLTYFQNIGLYDCTIKCVQWIQCMTVNYSFKQSICELIDSDFDEFETDGPYPDPEWINLGTPKRTSVKKKIYINLQPRNQGYSVCLGVEDDQFEVREISILVDGGFSSWKNARSCSASCGNGTQRRFRECDNPRPQHGGEECKGERVKNVHCYLSLCPVHGNWGNWGNFINVCEGEIEKKRTRHCDSPAPNSLGLPCMKKDSKQGLEEIETVLYPDNIQCVCYGDKGHTFGTIKVRPFGYLKSIRLTHVSGYVSCNKEKQPSAWGCTTSYLPIIATEDKKTIIFPDESLDNYKRKVLESRDYMSNEIIYSFFTSYFSNGEDLRIWFYEDFIADRSSDDNSGNKHCVHVDIDYLNHNDFFTSG